jgi:beta-galactosidase
MGFFVIPENRSLSTAQLGFLRTLVRQFRNSPSILLWSLENEELTLQGTVTGMAILKRLVAEVKRFDPSRHTCVGGVIHLDHPYHDITSVIGIHYQGLVNTIEKVTGYFQDKPHIQDECGLHAPTRGVYTTQPGRNSEFSTISGLMPSFANMTKIPALGSGDLKARDNISTILTDVFLDSTTTGGCIWTGMDYHGEPVPTAWPSVISAYGARDLIGLPKDYYWLVRCIFKRDEPLVHTFPHWTWPGKEEERIPFRVYSNCHSVQVLVNGQTVVGKRAVEKSTAYFPEGILYTPGKLLVRGLDAAGAVVAEHQVRTAGRPHRLVLQSDRSKLAPNGDVSTIRVAVVDENGILVPTANNMIHFALEQVGHQPAGTGSPDARIIGVGNGDNAATGESEQGNQRSAFNGWAAVLVQSSQISGQVKLVARSTGLVNGQVLVDISPNAKPHAVYLARDERDGPAGTHRSFGQARAAL